MEQRWQQDSESEQSKPHPFYSREATRTPNSRAVGSPGLIQSLGAWQRPADPEPSETEMSVDEWIAEKLLASYPPETFFNALKAQLHISEEFSQLSQEL